METDSGIHPQASKRFSKKLASVSTRNLTDKLLCFLNLSEAKRRVEKTVKGRADA
ncbi:MAG: hypothetical protein QXJ02_05260 [Candidatus Bathyarchaeia archaeon]